MLTFPLSSMERTAIEAAVGYLSRSNSAQASSARRRALRMAKFIPSATCAGVSLPRYCDRFFLPFPVYPFDAATVFEELGICVRFGSILVGPSLLSDVRRMPFNVARHPVAKAPAVQGQILLDARMSLLFIVFWRCARVAGRVPDGGRVRSVFLRCVEGFWAASGGLGRVAGEPVGWRGGVRTRRRLWGGRTLSVWLVRGALARRRGGVARSAGGLGGDNRSAL